MTFKSLLEFTKKFGTDNKCEKFLIEKRFGGKVFCVYCEHKSVCTVADGRYKCAKCNNKFSIKVGTVFEGSKVGLSKWFLAMYFLTCSAKGISSNQLAKDIDVSQKTAWFMMHRLRQLLQRHHNKDVFSGICEVDETFVGGKYENMHQDKKATQPQKAIVIGIVNRHTKMVKSKVIASTQYCDLADEIIDNVKLGSHVITDDLNSYKMLNLYYKHDSVNHSATEYARGEVYTNTTEGYFSLIKRTINGTWHWVSKKHTNRYLNEINYRYNHRELDSCNKFAFFASTLKARLTYSKLTATLT